MGLHVSRGSARNCLHTESTEHTEVFIIINRKERKFCFVLALCGVRISVCSVDSVSNFFLLLHAKHLDIID